MSRHPSCFHGLRAWPQAFLGVEFGKRLQARLVKAQGWAWVCWHVLYLSPLASWRQGQVEGDRHFRVVELV